MKEMLNEAFERYGLSTEVRHGGRTVRTKAFIQPLRRESGEEPFSMTVLGAVSEQCWRYLGPAAVGIETGDCVVCRERRYVVRRAAPFYAGEEIVYYWAILHPEEASA